MLSQPGLQSWFESQMSPTVSCIWTRGSQLVVPFPEAVGPWDSKQSWRRVQGVRARGVGWLLPDPASGLVVCAQPDPARSAEHWAQAPTTVTDCPGQP